MTPALQAAVELLERSLVWTSAALDGVDASPGGNLDVPTPCAGWTLRELLDHMDDSLDAFTEAASGFVDVAPTRPAVPTHPPSYDVVAALRDKACALLGAWLPTDPAPVARVGVGAARLEAPVLVATAALEITVHGWDVARATGSHRPLPDDLATSLLGIAHGVLLPADRRGRFAEPLRAAARARPGVVLLAHLGRVEPPDGGHPGSFRRPDGRGARAAS